MSPPSAMRGLSWLMAAVIYGGGLRVSECCQLRVKDLDFDHGLVLVRSGKGAKDRSTLLADVGLGGCPFERLNRVLAERRREDGDRGVSRKLAGVAW